MLHSLLQQLQQKNLPRPRRGALIDAFFDTLDQKRPEWSQLLNELREELEVLRLDLDKQAQLVAAQPPPEKFTDQDRDLGLDKESRRVWIRWDLLRQDVADYSEYARTLGNLLSLNRENFRPEKWRIPDLIAKKCLGPANSIYQLQNYVVGLDSAGLVFADDGAFNPQASFKRIDYLDLLLTQTVRNNVQAGVSNRPVDFVALRLPTANFGDQLREFAPLDSQVVWLYGGRGKQSLILSRTDSNGNLNLRYLPIAQLSQAADNSITFAPAEWQNDLPLRIWEDANLNAPNREQFLNQWHDDKTWLMALHQTLYSNGLIGLHEQLTRHPTPATDSDSAQLDPAERLRRRFLRRQRVLAETDLLVLANNHWNFDVRGFNPGGNHGSFFRNSTHSTLMFAGGANTSVPRGKVVTEPYDSLSFAPTLLTLAGQLDPTTGQPLPTLQQRGFRPYPGRVINELLGNRNGTGLPALRR